MLSVVIPVKQLSSVPAKRLLAADWAPSSPSPADIARFDLKTSRQWVAASLAAPAGNLGTFYAWFS